MKIVALVFTIVLLAIGDSSAKIHSWKGVVHLAAVPFIAGTGIYSDVRILQDAEDNGTKAGAITNLSLLGVQTALGATILFTSDDMPPALRIIHRIVGASVIASGLWISIAGTMDDGVVRAARYTSYTHTVLAAAPLILFTF